MKYVTKIILIMTCLIIMLPFGGCGRKKQVTAQKAGLQRSLSDGYAHSAHIAYNAILN